MAAEPFKVMMSFATVLEAIFFLVWRMNGKKWESGLVDNEMGEKGFNVLVREETQKMVQMWIREEKLWCNLMKIVAGILERKRKKRGGRLWATASFLLVEFQRLLFWIFKFLWKDCVASLPHNLWQRSWISVLSKLSPNAVIVIGPYLIWFLGWIMNSLLVNHTMRHRSCNPNCPSCGPYCDGRFACIV